MYLGLLGRLTILQYCEASYPLPFGIILVKNIANPSNIRGYLNI